MIGWIKIYRSIQDHWIWEDEPYDKARAFIDLIMLANYEDNKTVYKGELITCKRGDVNLSISYLAHRWKWSRKKVTSFLRLLESDGMVTTKVTTHRTVITIENYGIYQCDDTAKVATKVSAKVATEVTAEEQQAHTTKKDKKDKEIKKDIYCREILDYLNQKVGTNYKATTPKTQQLIATRMKEGFTVDDFKKVIDNMYSEWHSDEKMSAYLRPETLFGTKFEGYLNRKEQSHGSSSSWYNGHSVV